MYKYASCCLCLCLLSVGCLKSRLPIEGTWTYDDGIELTFKKNNRAVLGDGTECDYSVSKDSVITLFDARNDDSIIPMKYKIDKLTEDTLIMRRKTWIKGEVNGDILVRVDD